MPESAPPHGLDDQPLSASIHQALAAQPESLADGTLLIHALQRIGSIGSAPSSSEVDCGCFASARQGLAVSPQSGTNAGFIGSSNLSSAATAAQQARRERPLWAKKPHDCFRQGVKLLGEE